MLKIHQYFCFYLRCCIKCLEQLWFWTLCARGYYYGAVCGGPAGGPRDGAGGHPQKNPLVISLNWQFIRYKWFNCCLSRAILALFKLVISLALVILLLYESCNYAIFKIVNYITVSGPRAEKITKEQKKKNIDTLFLCGREPCQIL